MPGVYGICMIAHDRIGDIVGYAVEMPVVLRVAAVGDSSEWGLSNR